MPATASSLEEQQSLQLHTPITSISHTDQSAVVVSHIHPAILVSVICISDRHQVSNPYSVLQAAATSTEPQYLKNSQFDRWQLSLVKYQCYHQQQQQLLVPPTCNSHQY